jgi:uroporphyrinogen decarboxylase
VTANKPLLRALSGEAVWPPPIWLMRQAGRYLPEYRAVRAGVRDFIALCTTPEKAADVTLQPIRRYGMDAAILFSDILVVPWALGQGLKFVEGEGPVLPPIRDAAGVAALDPGKLDAAVARVMETVRRVRAGLAGSSTTLIGFAGAPFTVACYMVEGGGSRDFATVRALAYAQPDVLAALMETLVQATITYLDQQIQAGAEVVMLFDSWAGVLSPSLFDRHVVEPARRIVAAIRQRHPFIPVIGFPRLASTMLPRYVATGVNGIGMDTGMDPAYAASVVPKSIALQGNLDPMALVAGGNALRTEIDAVLAPMRGRPYIFNLGHGIVPQTNPDHVAALIAQVRASSP